MTLEPVFASEPAEPSVAAPRQRDLTFSVIVPTYDRPVSLRECLLSLRSQSFPADEVFVTIRDDDHATLRELPALRQILDFEVVQLGRPGQTHALNQAIARASGDVAVFIDDDAVAHRDWLKLIAEQYRDPAVGAVGGKLIVPQQTARGSDEQLAVGVVSRFGQPNGNHHLADGRPRDVQWLRGANMSFRREIGRFDESLRGSGAQVANDSEASLRVHAAGWRVVYVPQASVFHNAAPRKDEDQRGSPSSRAMRDAAFNQLLALLRWLPAGQRSKVAVYLLLIGVPHAPGPIGALRWAVSGRIDVTRAAQLSAHATAARIAALREWRRNHGAEDAAPRGPR